MASPDQKYEIITRRLQEVLGGDTIKAILDDGKSPVAYWGAYNAIDCFSQHLLIKYNPLSGAAPTGRRETHFHND